MNWNENEEVWKMIDRLLKNSEEDVMRLCSEMWNHVEELDIIAQAFIFGGLGKISMIYNEERKKNQSFEMCLVTAIQAVKEDDRVKNLMKQVMNNMIDNKVNQIKEMNENGS